MSIQTKIKVEDTQQPALTRAVIRQTGRENLDDIARHGVGGGFAGFIYYTDTVKFFKAHRAEIVKRAEGTAEELGENVIDMIAGFGCLAGNEVHRLPEHEKREKLKEYYPSISRCLYGGRLTDEDTDVANALAWFAAEEVAREMCPDI